MISQQQTDGFLASYIPNMSLSTEIVCYSIFAAVAIIIVVGTASVLFYKPPKPRETIKENQLNPAKPADNGFDESELFYTDNLFLENLERQHRVKKQQARETASTPDTTGPVIIHHLQTQMYDSYRPSPSSSGIKSSGGSSSDDSSPSSSSSSDSSSSSSD